MHVLYVLPKIDNPHLGTIVVISNIKYVNISAHIKFHIKVGLNSLISIDLFKARFIKTYFVLKMNFLLWIPK